MRSNQSNLRASLPVDKQQLRALNLPIFDSFPYLMTRMVPALYHIAVLPCSYERSLLREIAQRQVVANQLQTCLVLSSDDCCYYTPEGEESHSFDIPHGGFLVSGKLKLCESFEETPDLTARRKYLEAYTQNRNRGAGYLVGDRTESVREADSAEQTRLHGRQKGGVPRGLVKCWVCGEWKGECLDTNPLFSTKIIRVHCVCENHNLCAACGQTLYRWKLNANYYDKSSEQILHVAGFCGLSHICQGVQ